MTNTTAITCDTTSTADVNALVSEISSKYPELSALINNAGKALMYTHSETAGAADKQSRKPQLVQKTPFASPIKR